MPVIATDSPSTIDLAEMVHRRGHDISCPYQKLRRGGEFADPNVAEADGVVVVLEGDWKFVGVGFVGLAGDGRALDFDVVLNENAVVEDGDSAETYEFPVFIEFGGMENDVVGLPLAWSA